MNECKECSSSAKVISGTETTRRRFLVAMMAIASFLLSVILGIPFIGALVRSNFSSQKQKWVKVADMQSIPEDVPTRLNFTRREQDAFLEQTAVQSVWVVMHSASEVTVYSPICPHAGCYYNWNDQLRRFECPCHGSVFSIDGTVISGPAPRPLDKLPVEVENGALFVTWERFKSGIPEKIKV
ncbi:MAG: ubiquinol-cytochrome c reductase iron-sulfur subunit [Dissulfurispiraceae bacterium]|jgi:menaquinol-cytochrome c reductase iron-sulfur subunit